MHREFLSFNCIIEISLISRNPRFPTQINRIGSDDGIFVFS